MDITASTHLPTKSSCLQMFYEEVTDRYRHIRIVIYRQCLTYWSRVIVEVMYSPFTGFRTVKRSTITVKNIRANRFR